jgi:predicted KAP-like P-loop ATPase
MTTNKTSNGKIEQKNFKNESFHSDNPIEDKKDDVLGRYQFSKDIASSLLNWNSNESIVVGLNGEWGSGKTSIVNLIKQYINADTTIVKPVIIDFNPWIFSKREDITRHFFDEIEAAFKYKNNSKKSRDIAKLLKVFRACLSCGEYVYPPLKLAKGVVKKLENRFEKSASISVLKAKEELNRYLIDNNQKIIVFVDDIDRLTSEEIRELFRLVRINADFSKMIYVLPFDRRIVEKSLEEHGKDYLDKIIQVNLNVPDISKEKLSQFLFKELDRVLHKLPRSAQNCFNADDKESRWACIRPLFKEFFKNIRDVKRFINGFEFNISRMCKNNEIEINPIDFIAIEAIRVFAYDFYLFIANNQTSFTGKDETEFFIHAMSQEEEEKLKKEEIKLKIENILKNYTDKYCYAIKGLIGELFPYTSSILTPLNIYSLYDEPLWNRQLRICAPQFFKAYFNFIPGGDEGELSKFEIIEILNSASSVEKFKESLCKHIESKKIGKILKRIQDFATDEKNIPESNVKNIISALFSISEDLFKDPHIDLDFEIRTDVEGMIRRLLYREKSKTENFNLLRKLIAKTQHLCQQFYMVYKIDSALPQDKVIELRKICCGKINDMHEKDIVNHKDLECILIPWKEWDSIKLNEFINKILKNDTYTITFVSKFILQKTSREMRYRGLSDYINLQDIKDRFDNIKKSKTSLYVSHKNTIDLFLDGYEKHNLVF